MLKLNIIPDNLKEEIKKKGTYLHLKTAYGIIVVSLSFFAIVLLVGKLIIFGHFIDTIYESTALTKNTDNHSKLVKQINSKITLTEKIQEKDKEWSEFLAYIEQSTKPLRIDNISIDKGKNTFQINGFADTREDLLKLKEILEKCPVLTEIVFPRSNLLKKESIDFQLSATFKNYDFEQLQ